MMRKPVLLVAALLAAAPCLAADMVRCTAADQSYSYLRRAPCPVATDVMTPMTTVKPLLPRSAANTDLIRCTSRDGKRQSIQRGNCNDETDFQQRLGDR